MKKIIVMLFAVAGSFTVSAQKIAHGLGGRHHVAPRAVYVVPSYSVGFGLPFYGYPYGYYGYPYYGYPPFARYERMPSRLNVEIQLIKSDYKDKIRATRRDKSLSKSDRKAQIRSLKSDREKDILNAELNYRPNRRMNGGYDRPNNVQPNGSYQQPDDNSGRSGTES